MTAVDLSAYPVRYLALRKVIEIKLEFCPDLVVLVYWSCHTDGCCNAVSATAVTYACVGCK